MIAPSPSNTRPSIRIRSPVTSGVTMVLKKMSCPPKRDGSSPIWKYGPTVEDGVISATSMLHRSLLTPAQHDIEAVAQSPFGRGVFEIESRDHAGPGFRIGHRI